MSTYFNCTMSVVTPRPSAASVISSSSFAGNTRDSSQVFKPKLSRQLQQPHVTLVEYKTARFLITDQPNHLNMKNFVLACQLHQVRLLVRVCEPTYNEGPLEDAGIKVVDMEFDDGAPPPDHVLDTWFQLIQNLWNTHPGSCVAVHCKAGLGRAPALVAVALVELGLPYDQAIDMIRSRRPGALNTRQIQYLKNFRSRRRLRLKGHSDRCQII